MRQRAILVKDERKRVGTGKRRTFTTVHKAVKKMHKGFGLLQAAKRKHRNRLALKG